MPVESEWVKEALARVRSLRYGLGVAALAIMVATVVRTGVKLSVLVLGTMAILILMVVLLLFERLSRTITKLQVPAITLAWFSTGTFMLAVVLLFTSACTDHPLPIKRAWFPPQLPPPPTAEQKLEAAVNHVQKLRGDYENTSFTDYITLRYALLDDIQVMSKQPDKQLSFGAQVRKYHFIAYAYDIAADAADRTTDPAAASEYARAAISAGDSALSRIKECKTKNGDSPYLTSVCQWIDSDFQRDRAYFCIAFANAILFRHGDKNAGVAGREARARMSPTFCIIEKVNQNPVLRGLDGG